MKIRVSVASFDDLENMSVHDAKILNLTNELGEKRIETKQINSRDDEYNAPIV